MCVWHADQLRLRDDLALDDDANEKLAALYARLFRDAEATVADPARMIVGLRTSKVEPQPQPPYDPYDPRRPPQVSTRAPL